VQTSPTQRAIDPRFVFNGPRLKYVSFPLGGIGTGSVSLTGGGRLSDWSIRNRPGIHQQNGYSHFAIKAEQRGEILDARVLNGPFEGPAAGSPSTRKFEGYGFGADRGSMAGMPHFADVTFVGRFPVAELQFEDRSFPGLVRMTAFSPFIPHNDRDSSMPAALFEIDIENSTDASIDYTVASTLGNYGCDSGIHRFSKANGLSALHLTSADEHRPAEERGDLAITTDGEVVEHVDYHFRGQWFDSLGRFWREFARGGRPRERTYDAPRPAKNTSQPEHGTLAVRIRIEPNETRRVRFALTWNYPLGSIYWFDRLQPDYADYAGRPPVWKNYYATQWVDAAASGADACTRWDELKGQTFAFRDSVFGSSLPAEIIDAATATLGILRSATLIRLEHGGVWGWEGQHIREGSCEGSCTHVWNYQQALSSLFPALERSLREIEFTYNQLPSGGLTYRHRLPLGSGLDINNPCADGHFGAIVKMYREWIALGDDAWLRRYWPNVRRAMEYAWSQENPDKWDPDRTGVLWGCQHHTLDMELFGPNSWLTSMYLAALKAASLMGDAAFARQCSEIAEKGRAYVDRALFNGRYYCQNLDLRDHAVLEPFIASGRRPGTLSDSFEEAYWSDEFGEIKYQIGAGCLTDQVVGQWHADFAGLGDLFEPQNIRTALKSIFDANFLPSLRRHFNPCRVFALEDEGGVVICTWPHGARKPAVPVPYAEEVWTGLEYMIASHMIRRGLVEEGLTIVRAARARHDGARRNPWNDLECGSYYARALSSYALVNAFSGLTFDQRKGEIGFCPARSGDGKYFWSAGRGWGEVAFRGASVTLVVLGGELSLARLALPNICGPATVDGCPLGRDGSAILLGRTRTLGAGQRLVVSVDTPGNETRGDA